MIVPEQGGPPQPWPRPAVSPRSLLLMSRATRAAADLKELKSHGGKLILTHRFADPAVPDKS